MENSKKAANFFFIEEIRCFLFLPESRGVLPVKQVVRSIKAQTPRVHRLKAG